VSEVMALTPDQIERIYRDFNRKRRTTDYLRTPPISLPFD